MRPLLAVCIDVREAERPMSVLPLLILLVAGPPDPRERVMLLSLRSPLEEPWRAQQGYDALTYDIELAVCPESCAISGSVRMTLGLETALDTLVVDLSSALTASEVSVDSAPAAFSHDGDRIRIPLFSRRPGDTLTVIVAYGGTPVAGGFGSFVCRSRDTSPQFWTLSQTDYAHTWWPCHDTPSDKALVTMTVSAPYPAGSFFVAANGILEGVEERGGWTTYRWRELHPIAPYLVSLAGTNYVALEDACLSVAGDTIPIRHYAYPEEREEAREDFSLTPLMIRAFEGRFGPYPFRPEKYGMAMIGRGGAMEHQTVTSYGDILVRGDHRYDWIVAHELAHQWWGDWVTCADWNHIWLNEGFASFSEAVWAEHNGGEQAYREYMLGQDYLLTSGNEFPGTVLDPDYTFSITVYDKGAWVLHMLRQLVGEEAFWRSLAEYGASFAHSNAVTDDFRRVVEANHGAPLDWFFQQWLCREGRPRLELSWDRMRCMGFDSIGVRIRQVQSGSPYRFALDVRFLGEGRDTTVVCQIGSADVSAHYAIPFPVNAWEVDPWHKVLLAVEEGPGAPNEQPPPLVFHPPWPNPSPFSPFVAVDLPDTRQVQLSVFDVLGRLVWSSAPRTAGPGTAILRWDAGTMRPDASPSGLYLLHVRAGSQSRTFPFARKRQTVYDSWR